MIISHEDHRSVFAAAIQLATAQVGGSRLDWTSEQGREVLNRCYEAALHLFTTTGPSALEAEPKVAASTTITDAYRVVSGPALAVDNPFEESPAGSLAEEEDGLSQEELDALKTSLSGGFRRPDQAASQPAPARIVQRR